MLSGDEDLEINALKQRGWSISAIARHVGRDRKTVRGYLNGEREVGVRERSEPDPFDAVEAYVRQRLKDDGSGGLPLVRCSSPTPPGAWRPRASPSTTSRPTGETTSGWS